MPVALISTRTSPAFGPSRSSSMISSGFFASNATAARVFICLLPQELGFCEFVNPERRQCLFVRGENAMGENPDEHPSLSPKHYTLTRDVKAGDCKRLDFSIGAVGGLRSGRAALRRKPLLRCGGQNLLHCGEGFLRPSPAPQN